MIKNIIFDLGNVVVPSTNLDMVKQFFENENDAITFSKNILGTAFWEQLDLGKLTMQEAVQKIIKERIIDVSNYDEVENFMTTWFLKRVPNLGVTELAKKLKEKGYKIFVLSNMSKESFEFLAEEYEFFTMLDGAVVSAYECVKKPDKKIFEILLERYSLIPEECILIDDTEENLKTANLIGIKGRVVVPNNIEDAKIMLKENSIIF